MDNKNIVEGLKAILDAIPYEITLKDCECEKYKNTITKNIDYIKQNSNRLIRLIDNVIDVNKFDYGY